MKREAVARGNRFPSFLSVQGMAPALSCNPGFCGEIQNFPAENNVFINGIANRYSVNPFRFNEVSII